MSVLTSTPVKKEDLDSEVRADLGPYHLAMVRAHVLGGWKNLPFELRHSLCDAQVDYILDPDDPPHNAWKCRGCTSPGNLLFRDLEMKTLPFVRLQQAFYIARVFSSKEGVQKLIYEDRNKGEGRGFYHLRPMTREERSDYHLHIIENLTQDFVHRRHLGGGKEGRP